MKNFKEWVLNAPEQGSDEEGDKNPPIITL